MALTRPREKDAELAGRLKAAGFTPVFVPVVAYISLPEGMAALEAALDEPWAWVVLTSPEAAARFLAALKGRPAPPVAALGAGTARVLEAAGVRPAFAPPRAYGRVLAEAGRTPAASSTRAVPAPNAATGGAGRPLSAAKNRAAASGLVSTTQAQGSSSAASRAAMPSGRLAYITTGTNTGVKPAAFSRRASSASFSFGRVRATRTALD